MSDELSKKKILENYKNMRKKALFVQMKLAVIHFFVVCSQIYQLRMKKKKIMAKNRSHSAVNYNREESE